MVNHLAVFVQAASKVFSIPILTSFTVNFAVLRLGHRYLRHQKTGGIVSGLLHFNEFLKM